MNEAEVDSCAQSILNAMREQRDTAWLAHFRAREEIGLLKELLSNALIPLEMISGETELKCKIREALRG